jgi:hypothetical protein
VKCTENIRVEELIKLGEVGESFALVTMKWTQFLQSVGRSYRPLFKLVFIANKYAPKNQYKYTLVLTLTNHKKCPKIFFYVARSEFIKFKMNAQQVPQCKQRRVAYLLTYILSETRHG